MFCDKRNKESVRKRECNIQRNKQNLQTKEFLTEALGNTKERRQNFIRGGRNITEEILQAVQKQRERKKLTVEMSEQLTAGNVN